MGDRLEDLWREYRYAAVNLTIAALQVIVFIINTAMHGELFAKGMLSPAAVLEDHEFWRLFTVVFLHTDFPHLMSNLVGQIALGNLLEQYYGHLRYLLIYVLCTIGADGVSMAHALRTGWTGGSVGSSGAVFGLLGVLVALIFMGRVYGNAETLRGRAVFMIIYAVYVGSQSTHIDNAAHAGGLVTGILCGLLFAPSARSGFRSPRSRRRRG